MTEKIVFIDRDGVINKDPHGWTKFGYVSEWDEFEFLPGVLEAFRKLTAAGYKNIIISNQQGVGKGYYTLDDLEEITMKMSGEIKRSGGYVDGTYYCPHLKEENCPCRKPKAGLFLKAREDMGITSFNGIFFIGDSERDIQAGKEMGMNTILVLSGKSSEKDADNWEFKPDHICRGLLEAADIIIGY